MKSLAELEAIKNKAKADMSARNQTAKRVVVGMATCGIAAGARPVMTAIVEELKTRGVSDVSVSMTGCLGLCKLEPIVEVIDADGKKVTYVKMDANKAKRVVAEHLINGQVCEDLTIAA
ncbi:MAG TPA: (2Fe-2S) ferredoxin domain-containing protein, partial [Bacillota bacterium]|nr:(2Fe-2S) ferredoxin domain-containing protein [Bacillota bacterium]